MHDKSEQPGRTQIWDLKSQILPGVESGKGNENQQEKFLQLYQQWKKD